MVALIGIQRQRDILDPLNVFGCIGDNQRIRVHNCLDITETCHQRPQSANCRCSGEVFQRHQPGDHIQPPQIRPGTDDRPALLDDRLRYDPPQIARGQRRESLHRQHGLIQLPHPVNAQCFAGYHRYSTGHVRVQHQRPPGDFGNLFRQGSDIGIAQVDHIGRLARWPGGRNDATRILRDRCRDNSGQQEKRTRGGVSDNAGKHCDPVHGNGNVSVMAAPPRRMSSRA